MASERLQRVLCDVEPDFLNLNASSGRTPSNTGLTGRALACANPVFNYNPTIVENEEVSNRFVNRAPIRTLRTGDISFDLYLRSVGTGGDFDSPMFDVLDAFFGISETSNASFTATAYGADSITLEDATSLTPGMGVALEFEGVSYVTFIKSIATDVLTVYPTLPADVIAGAPATVRGGRTYAVGTDFRAAASLYMQLEKAAYYHEAFGCYGNTLGLNLETGGMGVLNCNLRSNFINQSAGVPASVGVTAEPSGTWLKFLNAQAWVNDALTAIKSANWNINLAASELTDPHNAAGITGYSMGAAGIECEVTLANMDTGFKALFEAGTSLAVMCALGAGSGGNAAAIYCPAMQLSNEPVPGEADDLTTLPLPLRSASYTGDADDNDGTNVSNSICRMFFAL